MTIHSLYKVVSKSQNGVGINLDEANIIFKVHFEGNPILPGACMVEIARELSTELLGRELKIERIANIKFLKVVSPQEYREILYTFDFKPTDNNAVHTKIQVTSMDGQAIFARISMILL